MSILKCFKKDQRNDITVSLCIGGITWCLQPRCEFAASFWVCSLILNMWPHSDKEYAQLSKRDRVVLRVGPAFIIHYMIHILSSCMFSKTVSNESTHQQHFHRTCTSQNFIIEYSWYYISQFHQIGSNVLQMITFVTEWYMLISYRKHLFASVYLKKTPQIFPSSVTLLETNVFATTLNLCSF